MTAVLIALNVLAGLFLVGVVLLQSGKGADMGAAFGGASSTVFGPSGAGNTLTKITAATAAVFMGTSLALAVISAERPSVMNEFSEPQAAPLEPMEGSAPVAAVPATPPAQDAAEEAVDPLVDAAKKAAQDAVDTASSASAAAADTAGRAAAAASDAARQAAAPAAEKAAAAAEAARETPPPAPAIPPTGEPVDPAPSRP